jgi:hypothetical protein
MKRRRDKKKKKKSEGREGMKSDELKEYTLTDKRMNDQRIFC